MTKPSEKMLETAKKMGIKPDGLSKAELWQAIHLWVQRRQNELENFARKRRVVML